VLNVTGIVIVSAKKKKDETKKVCQSRGFDRRKCRIDRETSPTE